MKRPSSWLAVVAAAALGVSTMSCGSSTSSPGGNNFTAADQANLANALTNSGALNTTGLAGFASFLTQGVTSVGSMSAATSAAVNAAVNSAIRTSLSGVAAASYEGAVGFEVTYDISGTTPISGYFVGALGWNGLTNTGVSNFVMAGGGSTDTSTLPASVSATIGDTTGTAFGLYFDGTNTFLGTSGNVTITPSGFSGSSTDCGGTAQGVTVTCSYTLGTMSGSFNFSALGTSGTYTQPGVTFSALPAVKIKISI